MSKTIVESDWWRRAIAGEKLPIDPNHPQAGYFAKFAFRGGPRLPCRIWIDGAGAIFCTIAGEHKRPLQEWPYLASRPISRADFVSLCGTVGIVAGPTGVSRAALNDIEPPTFGSDGAPANGR